MDHCRPRLAGYKKPSAVEFAPELPRNASGKVLKRTLREVHGGRFAAGVVEAHNTPAP